MTRLTAWLGAGMGVWLSCAGAADADAERSIVERWRAERVAELTSEDGWLTLVGLYWLDEGSNTFGREASNRLVLDHPALAPVAGTFVRTGGTVRFIAQPGSGITHDGQPVSDIEMVPDTQGNPTVLSSEAKVAPFVSASKAPQATFDHQTSRGPLRFFVIERAGKLGVRVRDVDSPRRRHFAPIEYFPIDASWALDARFEPYEPHRHIRIVNILGLEVQMESPGAIIFHRDGHEWRLDTILEEPGDQTLFVMFADGTNGKQTYGGGRFLRVPLPRHAAGGTTEVTRVDFNESYNPPCAFNDFATCPLPPYQNRLALQVESGEKTYGKGHEPH